jgi:hypothetical protein
MSALPSLRVVVIGFSTKVWIPAERALVAMEKCVDAGVHIVTPSSSSALSISSSEEYEGTWKFFENDSALSLFMSQTAAKHWSSFRTLTWFLPHPPVPTTPILVTLAASARELF